MTCAHKIICLAGVLVLLISSTVAQDIDQLPTDVVSPLLHVRGSVRKMTVIDPTSSIAKIIADFDGRGRLYQVDEFAQTGTLIARARFTYERFGLASIQWQDASGKPRRSFEQTFTEEGVPTSYYEADATGLVLWKELFDVTDVTDRAHRRRFWLHLAPNEQLAESTRFVDCHGQCTVTALLVHDRTLATWRIQRDAHNRVIKSDIDYADLSFSYEQYFPDGSVYEHNFSSSSRVHTFSLRDSAGYPLSVIVEPEDGHRIDTSYRYGTDHLLTSEITETSGKVTVMAFHYLRDDHDNWVERRFTSPAGTKVVQRTIEYATIPRR